VKIGARVRWRSDAIDTVVHDGLPTVKGRDYLRRGSRGGPGGPGDPDWPRPLTIARLVLATPGRTGLWSQALGGCRAGRTSPGGRGACSH